ncbi:MAG TPA: glycerol-3-phosphate 1-O-acyltransferase PlsY [Candidatus Alectryocaccobium stercorigallinarum]|jgi:glycerol-3-phosphate acyltransferase PlsY|nr:glycerol-3-phosphate 1-O-acyltransferase PlsY [Candidatus Alectryocaccobium stercorigallinarum]
MERLICLAVGYCFGLIQTSYIFGKIKGFDIRKKGSGNAGTTNAIRTMGWKTGMLTLLVDVFKCIAAVLLMRYVFRASDISLLLGMYAAAGVILGHNFPFYLKFKGGKGIAASVGMMIAFGDWRLIIAGIICFFVPFLLTRYVSVGSLVLYAGFLVGMIISGQAGNYSMAQDALTEMYVLTAALTALAYWQHRANIKRLIQGKENRLF